MSVERNDRRQLHLAALAVVILVGTVGYLTGITRQAEPQGYLEHPAPAPAAEGVLVAPTQAEIALGLYSPNRGRFAANLAKLAANRRGLNDPVDRPTDAEWDLAVKARAKRRAFDGAPPVIPHTIDQTGFPNCLVCHRDGLVIEDRIAPAMSHEAMRNCTQCHVTQDDPLPVAALAGGPPSDNSFTGLGRTGRGERAGPGAPPTTPHGTRMRERCESCHGVLAQGLRTSHVCRQSCQQCHAPTAGADQPPGLPDRR